MENNKDTKISTPVAIIVAGALIMLAILITNGSGKINKEKTLSEQVGVSKEKFMQCLNGTDLKSLLAKTNEGADKAMSDLPVEERGTPYSIIIGKNGAKADIRGAYDKESVKKLIDEVLAGTSSYTGNVPDVTSEDHIIGNINAPIVIVEYSDLECPYCKKFSSTMKEIVAESNGSVAWVYRHWIIHEGALSKAAATECVATLKGNDAFWKYVDLIFGLMKTEETSSSTENL